jgi:hypothetical protein
MKQIGIKEHKHNLTQGLFEKSRQAQHAQEGHSLCWKEAKVLQIKPDATYREYKESTHVSLVDHLINQHSSNTSFMWTPIIAAEVRKACACPVYTMIEMCVFMFVERLFIS